MFNVNMIWVCWLEPYQKETILFRIRNEEQKWYSGRGMWVFVACQTDVGLLEYYIPANISERDIIANLAPLAPRSYPAHYHCKADIMSFSMVCDIPIYGL